MDNDEEDEIIISMLNLSWITERKIAGGDGKQRRDLSPIPIAPCSPFVMVVVGSCQAVPAAAHAGLVPWPSSYSDLSAPPSPNSQLRPRLSASCTARLD